MQFDGPRMIRDRSRLRRVVGTVALVSGLLVLDVQPSGALGDIPISNVSASLSVPPTAAGPFKVTGTITNAGNVTQRPGATVTITATGGTVGPESGSAECVFSNGVAVCTTSEILNPAVLGGTPKSFVVTVTPSLNAASVTTTVTTKANQLDVNAPAAADDTARGTTVVEVSNVSASLSVPATATAPFTATGTVTNSGNVAQVAGSTVTISATNGTVTAATSAQCVVSGDGAVCTAGALAPGEDQSFSVTVTPSTNAQSVDTTATTAANQPDVNAPAADDDSATGTTDIYSLRVDLTSQPSEVRRGTDTLLEAVVTNSGTAQSGVTLTIDTGGTVDEALALPTGCDVDPSVDAGKVTCSNIELGNGKTGSFTVAVTTPSTCGTPPSTCYTMRSTATVTGAYDSTGSGTTDTTLSDKAAAWVPEGGQLCFASNDQSSCFNVPLGWTGGLVVELGQVEINGTIGAEALWPKSSDRAHNDPNNPLVWNLSFNQKAACNGSGSDSCHSLAWGADADGALTPMEKCPSFATSKPNPPQMADPHKPCLNFIFRDTRGFVTYQVAWLLDAVVIPIISGKG